MTWIYMLKHKNEVFRCFKDFYKLVTNQFNAKIQILRTDNGTEYVNNEFISFISDQGIIHQTTCPGTPSQNGVAERKNRHLLEVARSLMFQMNVLKYLWSEAVMTVAYLINRMPPRVLGMRSPAELLLKQREFKVPPRVFGCVCFVHDHRPSVGKLDPQAVKCVFVGYASTQKGYKCWDPIRRRLFVSMDVTFREFEPYYSNKCDLDHFFDEFSSVNESDCRGGESNSKEGDKSTQEEAIVGRIPSIADETNGSKERNEVHDDNEVVVVGTIPCPKEYIGGNQDKEVRIDDMKTNEKQVIVYQRRRYKNQGEQFMQPEPQSPASPVLDLSSGLSPSSSSSLPKMGNTTPSPEHVDLPLAQRRDHRINAGKPPSRFGFEYDIANYMSYSNVSPAYRTFIASLQAVSIPKDWRCAKQNPRWKEAMEEELHALMRNKTWELAMLPEGKKAVGCKWIFTVKQTPEGKIDRYKARLVAKGYSQTYGIDYDETFAPVAKMGTVRTLISCAANFGWPLHQLDVKNAFLHGDLQEEVYMEIPPGFANEQTVGKVCKLKKSLYGLKQSPRAWFDRFRRAVCGMGYSQCNADHTVFSSTRVHLSLYWLFMLMIL
jgi:hypothetical protein